ncbi:hypothetical protein SLA2020_306830 [Shorea laevis]
MEAERVQVLAYGGLTELPTAFIRPAHERPENTKPLEGVIVPVVSLLLPHDDLVKKEVGQEFFHLPQEEKKAHANDPSKSKFEGYGTKMIENHDQKVESWVDYFFHLMSPPSKVTYDIWPQNPSSYSEEYNELLRVTDKLLELLSEGLGLDGEVLKPSLGGEELELEMKINMYPPCPQPHLALGVEPQTDMSALTLLVPNDVPGLQVNKEGNWVAVDYLPNALFVHIGDQIEVLSNGKYKRRLPQLLDQQNLAKYSAKRFAEYRYRKFNKLPQ